MSKAKSRAMTTKELEENLRTTDSIQTFLEKHYDVADPLNPGEYIQTMMAQKNVTKSALLKNVNLSKSFFYEILSGKKMPSRNNFLQLLISLGAAFDECQQALRACNYSPLYARNRWDAIIIYCIENNHSLVETNIMLESNGLTILY